MPVVMAADCEAEGYFCWCCWWEFPETGPLLVLAMWEKEKRSCCLRTAVSGFPAGKAGRFPAGCCRTLYYRILSSDKWIALIEAIFNSWASFNEKQKQQSELSSVLGEGDSATGTVTYKDLTLSFAFSLNFHWHFALAHCLADISKARSQTVSGVKAAGTDFQV